MMQALRYPGHGLLHEILSTAQVSQQTTTHYTHSQCDTPNTVQSTGLTVSMWNGVRNTMKITCWMFVTDPKPCATHTCRMLCPHGFALDDDGCPRCQCYDPCSDTVCPSALRCELEDVTCFKQPCPPIPRCEYSVSPWSRALLNVVTVAHLVKKSPPLM